RAEGQLLSSTQELQRSEFYLAEGERLSHIGSRGLDPTGFDYWSPELFRMHGLDPAHKPPTVEEYLDWTGAIRISLPNVICAVGALLTYGWLHSFGSPNESPKNPIIPVPSQRWPSIAIDYWLQAAPL